MKPIETDEEHEVALAELTAIIAGGNDPDPTSPVGERLLALAIEIEAYERKRWPI